MTINGISIIAARSLAPQRLKTGQGKQRIRFFNRDMNRIFLIFKHINKHTIPRAFTI